MNDQARQNLVRRIVTQLSDVDVTDLITELDERPDQLYTDVAELITKTRPSLARELFG
jgi:hypothetical protein